MKRSLDIVIASVGLVIFCPLMIIVGIVIKIDTPGPVFFRQTRVGRLERPFTIYKFRTMVHCLKKTSENIMVTASGDSRITRVGNVLREWKIDEVPQLVNVLLGDMSLVGPRPEVPQFVEYYSCEQRRILFSVKPGITDPATIAYIDEERMLSGIRNVEEIYVNEILPKKFELYNEYISKRDIVLDFKILVLTIMRILFRPRERAPDGER